MKRREFLVSAAAAAVATAARSRRRRSRRTVSRHAPAPTRKILIAGGGFNTAFIRYMAELTGKPRPKLLLPADGVAPIRRTGIIGWYRNCAPLNVEASHQVSFIASTQQPRSWEEVFLSVDGIVCSGGNTLNQQAIWKAQGIDSVLRQAWDRGIVLGGASAGSLCWFEEGTTDSRPKELSTVQCLGLPQGQPLAALRRRARPPAALSEADRGRAR